MDITRIDLFMPPYAEYGALSYFTKELNEALKRCGVSTRILVAERKNPKPFLEALLGQPPQCTLSFNGLLPDKSGVFFCDLIKIPHVALLIESPIQFLSLTHSKRNIIGCPDSYFEDFLRGINFPNVISFPHAVGRDLQPKKDRQLKLEISFFGTCIDYQEIQAEWKNRYPKELCALMHQTVESSLDEPDRSLAELFVGLINQQEGRSDAIDIDKVEILEVLSTLEHVISGKERAELISAIDGHKIAVFGGGPWENVLKGKKNVTFQGPIPFEAALEAMECSKIVLDSSPLLKKGIHERILAAFAAGSLPLTGRTTFKENTLPEALFFDYGFEGINQTLDEYLKDDEKRNSLSQKGREVVMKNHTFDSRAKHLLSQLSSLLQKEFAS